MTSIITLHDENMIAFWTDALCYDHSGVARFFHQKADIVMHLPGIIAMRGSGYAGVFARHKLTFCNTFDEAADQLSEITVNASHEADHLYRDPINLTVYLAGWSERAGAFERISCNYSRCRETGDLQEPSLQRYAAGEITVDPNVAPRALADAGLIGEDGGLVLTEVSRIMEVQRRTMHEFGPGSNDRGSIVGGFVQETRLFVDGFADTRIVHRWNEDKIGNRIDPAGQLFDSDGSPIEADAA